MKSMPCFSLTGKKILVVGAYSGLGSAFVEAASNQDAFMYLVGRREDELAGLQGCFPDNVQGYKTCDIADIDGFKSNLTQIAEEAGPFDGVFHCAGVESINSVRRLKEADLDKVFSGSFKGACAIASLAMKKSFLVDAGSVVLMSSVTSRRPQNGMAFYSASKAAIDALVASSAAELSGRAVRINSIIAGAVRTAMLEESLRIMPEAAQKAYEGNHLLGFGKPDDVTNAATYLLSDASRWVTGSGLVVDGGFLVK